MTNACGTRIAYVVTQRRRAGIAYAKLLRAHPLLHHIRKMDLFHFFELIFDVMLGYLFDESEIPS